MNCPNCAGELPQGAHNCPYCNAPVEEKQVAYTTERIQNAEKRTRTAAKKKKSARKTVLALVAILLLVIVLIAVFFGVKGFTNREKDEELTTEPPEIITITTEPETTEATTEAQTDHFAQAKETFYSLVDKVGNYIGDPISEFSISDKRPDANTYGNYAYIGNNYPDLVFAFTGSRESGTARLKTIYGEVKTILPGRSNYTYNELEEILGGKMSAKKDSSGNYTITYTTDTYKVIFYGPYMGSLDAGLDKFRIESLTEIKAPASTTAAKTTAVNKEEALKKDPDKYFAGNEKKTYTVATKGDKLNMRVFAGTDSKIVGAIPNKEAITVFGFYNGWAYVQSADGTKGWVSQNYITPAN